LLNLGFHDFSFLRALGTTAKDIPTLTPHLPAKANGAAMVLIPGGTFDMGSTREEVDRVIAECKEAGAPEAACKEWYRPESELPRHRVTVYAFYLLASAATGRVLRQNTVPPEHSLLVLPGRTGQGPVGHRHVHRVPEAEWAGRF
jgi:hypothetical protein